MITESRINGAETTLNFATGPAAGPPVLWMCPDETLRLVSGFLESH